MKHAKNKQIFSRVSFLDKLFFTKHLAMMLKSGITVTEAIETVADQAKSNKFRSILIDVSNSIRNGQTLARALSVHSKIFDAFYISLVEVGEASGTLDRNLRSKITGKRKELGSIEDAARHGARSLPIPQ